MGLLGIQKIIIAHLLKSNNGGDRMYKRSIDLLKATDGEPPLTVKNILYIYKKFNYPSIYLYASNHTAYKEWKIIEENNNIG